MVDSDGFGISDLIVVASQTGRTDKTDADGVFTIIAVKNRDINDDRDLLRESADE